MEITDEEKTDREKHIITFMIGVIWVLSMAVASTLTWITTQKPDIAKRDVQIVAMLMKTHQCTNAGSASADLGKGKLEIACWSDEVFSMRKGKKDTAAVRGGR